MKEVKVVFMGTPHFSVPVLEALVENCHVVGVVTQPDKVSGRDYKIVFSPVKEVALKHQIPVFQPVNIRTEYEMIFDVQPELIVTCAYGQIIPKAVLDYPKYGPINVHASLLPKLRGGDPIHRAILNGDEKTGITIMIMNEKMDAGPILRSAEIDILPSDSYGQLYDKLSLLGRDLLMDTIPDIISGNIEPIKQNHGDATYAPNLTREDERIDFKKTKREVINLIRGLKPFPVAYTTFETKNIKVWAAKEGEGIYTTHYDGEIVRLYDDGIGVKVNNGEIIFTEIQPEGKGRMKAKDYLNGLQNKKRLIGRMFI